MSRTSPHPLRRFVGVVLLAALFSTAGGLAVEWSAPAIESAFRVTMPVFLAALLGFVLIVRLVLRPAPRMHAAIEQQLEQLLTAEEVEDLRLRNVPETSSAAAGWNRLAMWLESRATLSQVEQTVDEKLARSQNVGDSTELVNGLPDGIAVTDPSGKLRLANGAFCSLLGVDPGESSSGQAIADVLPLAIADNRAVFDENTQEPFRPVTFELVLGEQTTDGVIRIARVPRNVENSTGIEQLWSVRDVTQQKLAQRAKTEFVETATHELRTPLANIRAYAELLELENDIDPEEQKKFLNILNSEAVRLSRFVDELLDVNKMEAGSMSLTTSEIDVMKLVEEVIEKVTPQMRQKSLRFETGIPAKLPKLAGDKDKLAACLVNLLGNAAKYTPEEGVVTFAMESEDGNLRFIVRDTGIGIPTDEQDRVFDKFFRSDDTRVRDIPGSGLGLAFCQEAVRLHGGEMAVRSEHNRGSEFSIRLPVSAFVPA